MLHPCQEINLLKVAQEHLLSNFLMLSKLTSQNIFGHLSKFQVIHCKHSDLKCNY